MACAPATTPAAKAYEVVPGQEGRIKLAYLGEDKVVWKNAGVTIHDLGDGIINVGFHTKMNTIGAEILQGLNHAFDLAEDASTPWRGVVISNEGGNFSAGANVGMVFMLAVEQEYDELDYAVRMFQNTVMRATTLQHPCRGGDPPDDAGRRLRIVHARRQGDRPCRDLHGTRGIRRRPDSRRCRHQGVRRAGFR